MRGVVVAVYVVDDENHPSAPYDSEEPSAVYCDVLTYGREQRFLPAVLVSYDFSGIHSGRVVRPRAALLDVTESTMDLDQATNPANLDGDHVLVGFLDENYNQPVILRWLPHPSRDIGKDDDEPGHRMKLKLADGDPDFWKHKGAYYGVSVDGDFVIDTTQAYPDEELQDNGSQPDPPEDGSTGNHKVRLPKGSTLEVQVEGGATFTIANKDADATLTLGDGAKSVAIAEESETLYSQLKGKLDQFAQHTHSSPVGPTGTPLPPITWPGWNSAIKSTSTKVPK
jgi:hypothetical protein